MFTTTRIRRHERGLWFHHGDFKGLVAPGVYRLWSRMWSHTRDRIEVVDTLETRFEHELLDVMLEDASLREELLIVDLDDTQRALVWKDGRLAYILGPDRHALWAQPFRLRVETFDVAEIPFEHPKAEAIRAHPGVSIWFRGVEVPAHEDVLLFRNGELVGRLPPGKHLFWKGAGNVHWEAVDRREQTADVAGQEIMTSDKVTLRVNLTVTYRVVDAEKAIGTVSDYSQALYREAQLVLRTAIGSKTLDALLSDKEALGASLRSALVGRAEEFGVQVRSVGLRDIILPGDMKTILNQVIEAEKRAEANLIRRREETAAARSQANTAKLLAENPTLARMKELELLQEILAGARTTFVLGSGSIPEQIRGLLGAHDVST